VLALLAAAAAFFLLRQDTAEDEDEDEAAMASQQSLKDRPLPSFLPMDSMVVNLADPGGHRVVQLGITLQLRDADASALVKAHMPSIRSGVLLLISQRSAEEVLRVEGKERLAHDITAEIAAVMGHPAGNGRSVPSRRSPVQAVLFSSFIVQ
jgi:flagellar protein FliL